MEKLDASAVAGLLTELGQRIELGGDTPFKARAYHRAAESLSVLTAPLDQLIADGKLRDIPGVGAAIAEKIEQLHRTGSHKTLERLRQSAPASVLDLLKIPGLRAEKVRQLFEELGITSRDELEEACRIGTLAEVKGLGPALQKKIQQGIEILRRSTGQRLLHHAGETLTLAITNLKASHPELERIVPAGDFRRGCELVHDLAIVAQSPDFAPPQVSRVGGEINVTITDAARYGAALVLATGSADHIAGLREIASARGMTLDGAGLRSGAEVIPCEHESDVYAALGLAFIAPELREGSDEIALAAAGRLPVLLTDHDLRGILHAHTDRSDGAASLGDMAEATRARGFQYFGVADHSQSAGYAGGLTIEEVDAQHAEADRLNKSYRGKFRILKGIESDILADGSLDYPDEVLARFEFVVASVHSRFALEEAAQTERILKAVSNPFTTILGHMTGRLLLRRDGYEVSIERILESCAKHDVAVEINANPNRLDLDWRWHRKALEFGCMFSVNPDAHSVAEIDLTHWGVVMARKGGVPKERVLNCTDLKTIGAFLKRSRKAARPSGKGDCPPGSM